jgi:hypothetical protein
MIRRAVRSFLRRRVRLEDDHAVINLQFVVGRHTIRNATEVTRNDAPRRGGFFTSMRPAQAGHGYGPDVLFDEEGLDIDEEGYVQLPDGTSIHVEDPRLTRVLSRFSL